jgi:SAM-dependent methyltransferase
VSEAELPPSRALLGGLLAEYLAEAPVALGLIRAIEAAWICHEPLPGLALDLGCGDGLFSAILRERLAQPPRLLIGVDLRPEELRRAAARGVHDALLAADICSLPFAAGTVDSVLANSVLEHVPSLEEALAEIRRVLRPGGHFLALTPSKDVGALFLWTRLLGGERSPAGRAYAAWKNRLWQHHHLLDEEEWRALLTRAGFRGIRVRRILSARVTALADLLFPAAATSRISLRLWDRWLLFPNALRGRLLARTLLPFCTPVGERCAGYVLSARAEGFAA